MNIIIPTFIYTRIQDYTLGLQLPEKQNIKVIRILITLWYYIYTQQQKDDETINLKGFTNISSSNLQSFNILLGNKRLKYKDLINILVNLNILEINNSYKVSDFTKSYRVITKEIDTNYTEFEIDLNKIGNTIRTKEYWLNIYPQYSKQINEAYDINININEYINHLMNNIGKEIKPKMINGIAYKRYLTIDKVYDYINQSVMINIKNLWFKISNEGRFYSSLTNLTSTSLPFMTLNNKEIVEVDVVNCQPLLLSLLISNEDYKKDCEDGTFYDKLALEINSTRNEAKLLSFRYIFFNEKKLRSGKLYNAFEKLYPGMINQINKLRNEINIARKMQTIESEIFIKNISYINIPMMLRHDAVFVYKENFDFIKEQIIIQFNKYNVNVKVK